MSLHNTESNFITIFITVIQKIEGGLAHFYIPEILKSPTYIENLQLIRIHNACYGRQCDLHKI